MAKIIAIANQKGGVAKTTTAVALVAAWVDQGRRALLVDCDPQASASAALGFDLERDYLSLYTLMSKARTRQPVAVAVVLAALPGGEALIPGHIDLALIDAELSANKILHREEILKDVLRPVRDQYDVIVLDCPPSLGWLTINALAAADTVLIPSVPDYLSARGLAALRDTVELVQDQLNHALTVAGVVLTRMRPQTLAHQERRADIAAFCADWGVPLLDVEIPDTIRAAEAAGKGVALTRYETARDARTSYHRLAELLLPGALAPEEAPHAR